MKAPLDPTPYPQDTRSQPFHNNLSDGNYVFVRDESGTIWVLPDGPHRHPRVLGLARPAVYAGDLRIQERELADLTNLSGTFLFDDVEGLREVAEEIRRCGMHVRTGAVRFFPTDGVQPPQVIE